jgi:hypothetical protein
MVGKYRMTPQVPGAWDYFTWSSFILLVPDWTLLNRFRFYG